MYAYIHQPVPEPVLYTHWELTGCTSPSDNICVKGRAGPLDA